MPADLGAFYAAEVLPRLTVDSVYAGVPWSSRRDRHWRAPCPLHGGDNPQAFSVDAQALTWHCFTGCNRGGDALDYLNGGEPARGRSYPDAIRKAAELAGVASEFPAFSGALKKGEALPRPRPRMRSTPAPEPTPGPELERRKQALQRAQKAFPGSPAAAYCETRGIPPELAARYGAGYVRSWRERGPRVVFPLDISTGETTYLANVYARSLDPHAPPGYARHAYLPGPKGIFNAAALADADEVFVTEAVFDALALIAAGHHNVIALGGLEDLPPAALRNVHTLHLCLDADDAGAKALHRLAAAAIQRGLRVTYLPPEALAGHKDLSAAWAATGRLDIHAAPPPPAASVAAPETARLPGHDVPIAGRKSPHSVTESGSAADVSDPRPDLADDAPLWRRLLARAAAAGADVYGAVLGVRCAGALLTEDGPGLRLMPRPGMESDYMQARAYLLPHTDTVAQLLRPHGN